MMKIGAKIHAYQLPSLVWQVVIIPLKATHCYLLWGETY